MSEIITSGGTYSITAGSGITFSNFSDSQNSIGFTATQSITPPPPVSGDYAFFIEPYLPQIENIVNVVLEPFDDSQQRPGYNYTLQLPQGGFIPPGQQTGRGGAWTNAGILDDNAMQMANSIDYYSVKFGKTPTTCAASCRAWWASNWINGQTGSSFPQAANYNPLTNPSRREIYWGKLSPVYGKINKVAGTSSQIYWAKTATPDGQDHSMNTSLPVVTAMPEGGQYDTNPGNFETFGAQIILHYVRGDHASALAMFAGAMKTVTSTGDLGSPYGGGTVRSIAFCLLASRITGYWQQYQTQIQSMLKLLWSLQIGTNGLPQTFTGPGQPHGNTGTPEPQGQALLLSDPNLLSYYQ